MERDFEVITEKAVNLMTYAGDEICELAHALLISDEQAEEILDALGAIKQKVREMAPEKD